jgi:hypothetical protein
VLIIGSGAGGGTLGNELAQKGIRTLILEAGPRLEREQHIDDERQSFAQLAWLDKRTTSGSNRPTPPSTLRSPVRAGPIDWPLPSCCFSSERTGRFPEMAEIHTSVVALVAQQLGIDTGPIADQACQGRTGKRHRGEIRVLFGFREPTVADGEATVAWLRDHGVCIVAIRSIWPPRSKCTAVVPRSNHRPPGRIDRIVRAATHACEECFCQRLSLGVDYEHSSYRLN